VKGSQEQPLPRKIHATRLVAAAMVFLGYLISTGPCAVAKPKKPPTLRWVHDASCCMFKRSDDGNYFYSLTTVDYVVTMRVDSQELSKVHHRIEPFFSVLLDVQYHGRGVLSIDPSKATLEFVRHHNIIRPAIDPDTFSLRTQAHVEQVEFDTEREIKKHPEKKEERERFLQTYKKEVTDLQDFLSRHTLSASDLTPANSETMGWVLFNTRNKWIDSWKMPEGFILRLPLDQLVIEFPFALPPEEDELELRRRPQ
jgi:hypothetical protein